MIIYYPTLEICPSSIVKSKDSLQAVGKYINRQGVFNFCYNSIRLGALFVFLDTIQSYFHAKY